MERPCRTPNLPNAYSESSMPEIASQPLAPPVAMPTPPDSVVVRLANVSVRYGRNFALRDVAATFETGAVGLLGPHGAGKSTMIKSLLGFIKPDQGQMTVLGLDVAHSPLEIRSRIGYMPENDAHIPGMN